MHCLRSLLVVALFLFSVSFAQADAPIANIVAPRWDLETMLMKGSFADLDALADSYRRDRLRMKGGFWAIARLYSDLSTMAEHCEPCGKATSKFGFEEKRKAFESWIAANPGSLTPKIALALMWQRYAWVGRGGAYASDTSGAQWAAFLGRMDHAIDLVRSLDHGADPNIFLVELDGVTTLDQPRQKLDEIYNQATAAFPDFPDYAPKRFEYLQERWFGRPGEAQAFAHSLLSEPVGVAGQTAYFDVAEEALCFENKYWAIFASSGIDYSSLAAAFAARSATFGLRNDDLNYMLFYAVGARDRSTARLLTRKIGDRWDARVWSSQDIYESVVRWAQ